MSRDTTWCFVRSVRVAIVLPMMQLIALTALRGQAADPRWNDLTINAPRPVMDAALLLEERYRAPVTYEDPVWEWRGDVYVVGGNDAAPMAWWLKSRLLILPDGLTPAESPVLNAALVGRVLDAYYNQNPGDARFRVTSSRLGLHIIPTAFHTADGKLAEAPALLDAYIRVPDARRMASDHLIALRTAVTESTGTLVEESGNDKWLDQFYAAGGLVPPKFATKLLTGKQQEPYSFVWGAAPMTARDALLSLLDSSATTLSWRLLCQPSGKPENRSCVLNVVPLQVPDLSADGKPVLDAAGKPKLRSLSYDRLKEPPKTLRRPASDR